MKLIYQKFSCISVLSQAELGMQLKTQLNWDQNCIFTEWNELDVRSAMFGMAEFWVSDFESISHLIPWNFHFSSFYGLKTRLGPDRMTVYIVLPLRLLSIKS